MSAQGQGRMDKQLDTLFSKVYLTQNRNNAIASHLKHLSFKFHNFLISLIMNNR